MNDGTVVSCGDAITPIHRQKAIGILYSIDERGTPRGWLGINNSANEEQDSGLYTWSFNYSLIFPETRCIPSAIGPNSAGTATFTGDVDGEDNWAYMCSIDSSTTEKRMYPAFTYVNNYATKYNIVGDYAEGWYMPSLAELCYIYRNKDKLNSVINMLGGTPLKDVNYWSSSEANKAILGYGCVYEVGFGTGGIGYNNKNSSGEYVCVIRSFRLLEVF